MITNYKPDSFWISVAQFIDEVRAAAEAGPKQLVEISGMLNCDEGMIPVSVFLGDREDVFKIVMRTLATVPAQHHDAFERAAAQFPGDVVVYDLSGHDEYVPQGARFGQICACAGYSYGLKNEWPVLVNIILDMCNDLRRGINAAETLIAGGTWSKAEECFHEDEESCYERRLKHFRPFYKTSDRVKEVGT